MPKRNDIYNHETNLAACGKHVQKSEISERNKKFISDFKDMCFSEGLSVPRIIKYTHTLVPLARDYMKKDFDTANRKDIENVLMQIERSNYAPNTKRDFKICIKKFYRWLRGTEEYPPEVKWIKTSLKQSQQLLPENLLLEEDVKKLIQAAGTTQHRALVSLLYESGMRVGELLTMDIGSVEFAEPGAALTIHGKTGSRRIRVISCVPYLSRWLDEHPKKGDKGAPLWISSQMRQRIKPMRYPIARKILLQIAQAAGVSKRVNPHSFRHARSTFLATKWPESTMKKFLGWVPGSDMAGVYVHLSGRDTDEAVLGLYGLLKKKEEDEKDSLSPRTCTRCKHVNEATNERCSVCTAPLTLKSADEMIQDFDKRDREFLDRMVRLMKEQAPDYIAFREKMLKTK